MSRALCLMIRAKWLIRAAALLVPAGRREEWRKEWLAELHYAQEHAGEAQSYAFARGAFHDAIWQQRDFWTFQRATRLAQAPWFCLASLTAMLLLLVLASGWLPLTRQALLPLPYQDAGRIVTIAQAGTVGTRAGVLSEDVAVWRQLSQTLDAIATYRWEAGQSVAGVSENFFGVLGAKAGFHGCGPAENCVVLSYDYWRNLNRAANVNVDGKPYRVAGVTERGFWFLSPKITMWRIESPAVGVRTGVVGRLRADASEKDAVTELGAILRDTRQNPWETIVELTGVTGRVHFVFWVFGFSVALACLILVPTLRLRMPKWNPSAAGFFLAKVCLLLAAVFLCGIEFTRASSITMLGGADGFTAVSAWLFVMGSTGALAWSIADQRQRCRVCLKRLGMAAHVGCTGCLLLDWAGTELVCVEGHGMLHVPEMAACWQDPDRWTVLDETWQGLFERG
jgi:hypothetical protein